MIPASDRWVSFASGLDSNEGKTRLRASDADACRPCVGGLSDSRSLPQCRSDRGRRHIDSRSAVLSVIMGAVRTCAQSGMVVIWKVLIHSRLQQLRSSAIVGIEISRLPNFSLIGYRSTSALIASTREKLDNLGEQPNERVHRHVLMEQRRTRYPVVDNTSQGLLDSEVRP